MTHKTALKAMAIFPLLLIYCYDNSMAMLGSEQDDFFTQTVIRSDSYDLELYPELYPGNDDALSNEQITSFRNDGFLMIPNAFTPEQIQSLSDCADRLLKIAESLTETGKVMHNGAKYVIEEAGNKKKLNRIVWAGVSEQKLLSIPLQQPKFLTAITQILGDNNPELLANQLHYKLPPPHPIVEFYWHQDTENRYKCDPNFQDVNGEGSFVQTIIAIDHMTNENGCIQYIPDSHTQGNRHFDRMTREEISSIVDDLSSPLAFNMKPGDVLIMHPFLIHGSFKNKSDMPRRTLINTFACRGAHTARIAERDKPVQDYLRSLIPLSQEQKKQNIRSSSERRTPVQDWLDMLDEETSFSHIIIPAQDDPISITALKEKEEGSIRTDLKQAMSQKPIMMIKKEIDLLQMSATPEDCASGKGDGIGFGK